jgi:hypothetical protein
MFRPFKPAIIRLYRTCEETIYDYILGVDCYLGDEISSYNIVLGVKAGCEHIIYVCICHLRDVHNECVTLACRLSQYDKVKFIK